VFSSPAEELCFQKQDLTGTVQGAEMSIENNVCIALRRPMSTYISYYLNVCNETCVCQCDKLHAVLNLYSVIFTVSLYSEYIQLANKKRKKHIYSYCIYFNVKTRNKSPLEHILGM
jgi:hypothetical protein